MGASAGTSRLPDWFRLDQQLEGGQHWVSHARRSKFQCLDQSGRKLVQCPPAIRGAQQRVFVSEVGQFFNFAADAQQLWPTDCIIHGLEGVALAFLRCGQRIDCAVKQTHQSADGSGACHVALARGVARLGEQAADQLVGHVQHCIGQSRFQVEKGCHENCAPPVRSIAPELVSIGGVSFSHELPQPLLVDVIGDLGTQANATDQRKPIEQFADVVRLWRDRHSLEPRKRCQVHGRIDDEQPIELGHLRVRDPGQNSALPHACGLGRGRQSRCAR